MKKFYLITAILLITCTLIYIFNKSEKEKQSGLGVNPLKVSVEQIIKDYENGDIELAVEKLQYLDEDWLDRRELGRITLANVHEIVKRLKEISEKAAKKVND